MRAMKKATVVATLCVAGALAAMLPSEAKAWGGYRGGVFIGVAPPVFAAPPPVVYAPPPVVYAPPPPPAYYVAPRHWVRGHYRGPYWIPGHWA